jgi:hypothetical protein
MGVTLLNQEFYDITKEIKTLDLQSIPSGVYILHYRTEDASGNTKIIKL